LSSYAIQINRLKKRNILGRITFLRRLAGKGEKRAAARNP